MALVGWKYRRPITINNTGNPSNLTNYQVVVIVDTASLVSAGKMRSDCGDIRFTDNDGNTLLSYWIESGINTSSTRIWVRVPSIPGGSTKVIYMYYGNPTATSRSNGSSVFDFFDDFTGTTLDTSRWFVASGTSYTVSNSILKITVGAIGLQSALAFNLNAGYLTEAMVRYDTNSESNYSGALEVSSSRFTGGNNANSDATVFCMVDSPASSTAVKGWAASGSSASYNIVGGVSLFTMSLNTWYILGNETTPNTAAFWNNYSRLSGYSVTWSKNIRYISLGAFNGAGSTDIKDTSYDWVRVRKYVPPQPTCSVSSSEQKITGSFPSFSQVDIEEQDNPVPFRLLVLNPSLELLGEVEQFSYLRFESYYRTVGNFELRISRYAPGADLLRVGNFLVLCDDNRIDAGRISYEELTLDEDGVGSEFWVKRGYDAGEIFLHRLCLNGITEGTGYDEAVGNPESIMHYFVWVNVTNPTDQNRKIINLAHGKNKSRGSEMAYAARLQTVAEVLENIAATSGLGWRIWLNLEEKRFYFGVLQGQDKSSAVKISPEFSNVKRITYRYDIQQSRNLVVVGGQGSGSSRYFLVYAQGSIPTGWNRREVFADARDLTDTALEQRGKEVLAEMGEVMSIEAEYFPAGPFVFGVDFKLGDFVTISYPGVATAVVRVLGVRREYSKDGKRITLIFGSEPKDVRLLLRYYRRLFIAEARR